MAAFKWMAIVDERVKVLHLTSSETGEMNLAGQYDKGLNTRNQFLNFKFNPEKLYGKLVAGVFLSGINFTGLYGLQLITDVY